MLLYGIAPDWWNAWTRKVEGKEGEDRDDCPYVLPHSVRRQISTRGKDIEKTLQFKRPYKDIIKYVYRPRLSTVSKRDLQ